MKILVTALAYTITTEGKYRLRKFRSSSKLIFGVGINDADYSVYRTENIDGKQKNVWTCPYYVCWVSMLRRCYSEITHKRLPTYRGCFVTEKWHSFMTFRAWMIEQDWEGKELDKDLLIPGNKEYSETTCIFIDRRVNSFIVEKSKAADGLPVGVYYYRPTDKFKAQCWDVKANKQKALGYFDNPEDAHKSWLAFKLKQAKILAAEQSNARISEALIKRYENYGIF